MVIIFLILASVFSGLLYRAGGYGRPFNTKFRDLGCPLITGLCVWFVLGIHGEWWMHLVCFLALFGALTTYWDFMFDFDNHWFHGFACGVAYIPLGAIDGNWNLWILRSLIIAVWMGAISAFSGNDSIEEIGRGSSLPLSLILII